MSTSTWSCTGSRQRPHSASTGARTTPETSTPSTTDSSRSSSSTGEPAGTWTSSRPQPSGAGAVRSTARIDPARLPSSRVSSTRGARGSRGIALRGADMEGLPRVVEDQWGPTGDSTGHRGPGPKNRPRRRSPGVNAGPGSLRQRTLVERRGLGQVIEFVPAADLGATLLDGLQRLVQHDLEVGELA